MLEQLKHEHDLPSQRWFGEFRQLFEPPNLEYAFKLNSEVPALDDNEFNIAWAKLQSFEGISSMEFWRMFDMCDCGVYIQKAIIDKHRKVNCPFSSEIPSVPNSNSTTPSHLQPPPRSGLSLMRPTSLANDSPVDMNSPTAYGSNDDDLYT